MLASGRAERGDFGVHGFELAHRAAEQDDFGAGRGQRQRHRAADAGARAGDHDDAAVQFLGLRLVTARVEIAVIARETSYSATVCPADSSSASSACGSRRAHELIRSGSIGRQSVEVTPSSVNLRACGITLRSIEPTAALKESTALPSERDRLSADGSRKS